MKRLFKLALAAALALPLFAPAAPVHAAASLQVAHAYLCAPQQTAAQPGPRRVVNTSSTASPQPSYVLNNAGCALIASSDVGFFLSQGFYYGSSDIALIQTGITASTTTSTSTITLPAYAVIKWIVLSETAGNAITGGVDIGISGTATAYASAVSLGANANVVVADSALTRIADASGVPTAHQVLVACHTSCNSGSINITVVYGFPW